MRELNLSKHHMRCNSVSSIEVDVRCQINRQTVNSQKNKAEGRGSHLIVVVYRSVDLCVGGPP